MEEILTSFKKYLEQPWVRAAELKDANGTKIIGCLPMYFPDEIVYAAGALPVTLFGSDEPITLADKHLMTNACDQVRSTFDSLLKGKYDFLDGVAAIHVCDQVRFFLGVWQLDHPFPFFHQMWRPYKLDHTNRMFLVSELKRLKSSLEDFTGTEITSATLRESIGIYNRSRSMMRRLNDLRKGHPGIISASDMVNVVASSMLIPREEHNRLLEELLSKIETGERQVDQRLRIVVVGHPCAVPEDGLLDMIEDLGMVIVDDDFFSGGRYYALDVNADGDPVEALADYYMNAVPCTTRHFPGNWVDGSNKYSPYADFVMDMVMKSQARGVVMIREMYCDPFDMEFVLLKQRMEDEHVPYLALTTEHGLGPLEPLRTRVQAFEETLRRG